MRLAPILAAIGVTTAGLGGAVTPPREIDGASHAGPAGYEIVLPPEAQTVTDVAVAPNGHVVVAGVTSDREFPVSRDAVDRSCSDPATAGGCTEGFVIVLDAAGSVRYATLVGGDGPEWRVGVAPALDGSIWALVSTSSRVIHERSGRECNGHQPVLLRISATGRAYEDVVCVGGRDAALSANAIALGPDGSVWVAGTDCQGHADVVNAWQPVPAGGCDIYVARYAAGQRRPLLATYVGGSRLDYPTAIATAADGDLLLTGVTLSRDFPSVRAFQGRHGGASGLDEFNHDAVLLRLDAAGRWMEYATYLGGVGQDQGLAVSCDADGTVYVVGSTSSDDFPSTAGPFAAGSGPHGEDGFLVGVDRSGGVRFSRVIGGDASDRARGVAVQADGTLLVVGQTASTDFPLVGTPGALRPDGASWELPFLVQTDRLATQLWQSLLLPVPTGTEAWGEGCMPENRLEAVTSDGVSVYVAGRTRVWSRASGDLLAVETGHYVKKWRVGRSPAPRSGPQ
jgi:hypothetical protein